MANLTAVIEGLESAQQQEQQTYEQESVAFNQADSQFYVP